MRRVVLCALVLGLPACSNDPTVGVADADFVLTSPAPGAIGVTGTPTFSWTTSIGTPTYTFQLATDSGFSAPLVDQPGIASTSVDPAVTLDPGTVYFWRVIANRDTGDVAAAGSPGSFTTVAPVPGDFTMLSPPNGSTSVSTTPSFTWNDSLGAASYRLQVAPDPGFSTFVVDQGGILSTSVTPSVTLTASTAYSWRVIAESATNVTATGAPFTFTTTQGPGQFTLAQPLSGATAVSTLPQFSWNPSSGAISYRLQVSPDFNFTTVALDQSNINALFFTPTSPLQPGTTYYWRVSAINANGTTPASPAPFFFTTS